AAADPAVAAAAAPRRRRARPGDPPAVPGLTRRLLRYLPTLIAIGLAVALVQKLDVRRTATAMRDANWWLVVAAVAINLTANQVARVQRWRTLLRPLPHPGPEPSFWELTA